MQADDLAVLHLYVVRQASLIEEHQLSMQLVVLHDLGIGIEVGLVAVLQLLVHGFYIVGNKSGLDHGIDNRQRLDIHTDTLLQSGIGGSSAADGQRQWQILS